MFDRQRIFKAYVWMFSIYASWWTGKVLIYNIILNPDYSRDLLDLYEKIRNVFWTIALVVFPIGSNLRLNPYYQVDYELQTVVFGLSIAITLPLGYFALRRLLKAKASWVLFGFIVVATGLSNQYIRPLTIMAYPSLYKFIQTFKFILAPMPEDNDHLSLISGVVYAYLVLLSAEYLGIFLLVIDSVLQALNKVASHATKPSVEQIPRHIKNPSN